MPLKLENLDFRFENSLARIVANRNHPEIKLAGLTVGPLQEGNEYEVYHWIAQELVEAGIAHFREDDSLDGKLNKIHFTELIQVPRQISEIPEDFYSKLRRYLADMKKETTKQPIQPEKVEDFEKAKQLARDIVNSRLRKIVALSSGTIQGDQVVRKLAPEEKLVYEQLSRIISQWRTQILEYETEG